MKHSSLLRRRILWMSLVGVAMLSGCGKSPTAPTAQGPQSSAAVSTAAVAVPATPAPAATDAPEAEAAAPETTETGTVTSSGPALALRIAEVKPEPALAWQEGQHYLRLMPTQPTAALPGQIEVTEFFWYGCPHCAAFDPYLEAWLKRGKPAYVSFVRVPIIWSPMHGLHARIYYTAQALGQLDALHTLIFAEFHQQHHPLNTPDEVAAFFTAHGVSQARFQQAFTSQAVDASLSNAQQLALRFKVESVPLIIINGKYLTDVGKAGSPEKLISLINDLAAREHGSQS